MHCVVFETLQSKKRFAEHLLKTLSPKRNTGKVCLLLPSLPPLPLSLPTRAPDVFDDERPSPIPSADGGGRTGAVRSRRGMAATRPVDEVASTGTRAEADAAEAAMGCGVGRRFIFGVFWLQCTSAAAAAK